MMLVCLSTGASAQRIAFEEKAETAFTQALQKFEEKDFRSAEKGFAAIETQYPESHRITAAMIMRAKALFVLNESYDASKEARALLTRFPLSRYAPDAQLVLGEIYVHIERFDEARETLFRAWRVLPDVAPARLKGEILVVLDSVLEHHTTLPVLYDAIAQSDRRGERAHLWLIAAIAEMGRGNVVATSVAVDTLTVRYRDEFPADVLENLRAEVHGAISVKVGVVLPLMRSSPPSAIKEIGNDVDEGILTAYDRITRTTSPVKITLEIRDTERETQTATSVVRELAGDHAIIGLLGPVFSTTTTAAARVAVAYGIPLVTPTANQNGIAAMGTCIFQANPDYEQRGKGMARYAVLQLGCHVVGIVAPSDTYAKYLADAFVKEARALGAEVACVEWYQKGTTDLRAQLMNVRRASLRHTGEPMVTFGGKMSRMDAVNFARLGIPPSRIDSLLAKGATVPARWLLGPRGASIIDSAGLNLWFDESKLDSLQQPVTGIQAMYCPISSPEEIGVVSSQIVYYNLKCHILGSGEWNSISDLETSRRYCTGVQFESDSYVDTSSTGYRDFLSAYSARFKKHPGKNAFYGYDAASMMFSLILQGATTREAVLRALSTAHHYQGVKGQITFSGGRVNSWMNVLEYTPDGIIRVGETRGED